MNVKILFTFQAIFVYKSYWLLIFKSEKDKVIVLWESMACEESQTAGTLELEDGLKGK